MEERTEEHKCPDCLEMLVLGTPKSVFKMFSIEPNIEDVRRVMEMDGEEISDYNLMERYKEFVKDYHENQNIAFELSKYGKTTEEITEKLGDEIVICPNCSLKYMHLLLKIAISDINLSKHEDPLIAEMHKKYTKSGLIKRFIELDKNYLNLFSRYKFR